MFLSLFVTFQDLGAALGPLLSYWIAPRFGLVWMYGLGASLLAVSSLLYLIVFRTTMPPHDPAAADRRAG